MRPAQEKTAGERIPRRPVLRFESRSRPAQDYFFLAAAFFFVVFLATFFLATFFLAAAFLVAAFLLAAFFVAAFFAAFFLATFSPPITTENQEKRRPSTKTATCFRQPLFRIKKIP